MWVPFLNWLVEIIARARLATVCGPAGGRGLSVQGDERVEVHAPAHNEHADGVGDRGIEPIAGEDDLRRSRPAVRAQIDCRARLLRRGRIEADLGRSEVASPGH